MAQTQAIKRRIRSVSNTKQITKAMELVSASKMRRGQEAALKSRAYTGSGREVLARLTQLTDAKKFPLFAQREIKSRLVILITSDRGLAGAYNSNILRSFTSDVRRAAEAEVETKVIVIGSQGAKFVKRLENIDLIGAYPGWPTEPTSADVRPITHTATKLFIDSKIDKVEIFYTHFVSTIRQEVALETLLPVSLANTHDEDIEVGKNVEEAKFEPSARAVLEAIVPRLIEAQLFQTILESIASEHSMRMMAMKSASDNAEDLIEDLTLEYNSARQAGITQELAEITAGAEAISVS